MSRPGKIHSYQDESRTASDATHASEPSLSYEQENSLAIEDDFHRRQSGRRDSGGGNSFWRTSMEAAASQEGEPQFSSMNMKQQYREMKQTNGSVRGRHRRVGSGRIGAALISSGATEDRSAQTKENRKATLPRNGNDITDDAKKMRRKDSACSVTSNSSKETKGGKEVKNKKDLSKNRTVARRIKLEAGKGEVDMGHLIEDGDKPLPPQPEGNLSRESTTGSEHSGSLIYGKATLSKKSSGGSRAGDSTAGASSSGVLLGKSSSLIFPTGVEANSEENEEMTNVKRRKINMLLDQCETVRFPFKKKLMMENLNLMANDVPVRDLCNTSLGNTLHKLSLSGNRLSVVPDQLVCCLPALKTLDLSQCDLHDLPEKWNLPQLRRLNLSHNRLVEIPDEGMLEGMLELQDLNMYGNKVAHIVVPRNPKVLAKLETLNLGYNDLAYLPDELDQLKSLRTLKVQNNFLEKVPSRVCDMDIRTIDVSSNPVIQPPIETCERGVCSMKRYYACLRLEEQAKQRAMGEAKKKLDKQKQKQASKRGKKRFFSAPCSLKGTLNTAQSISGSISSGLKTKSDTSSIRKKEISNKDDDSAASIKLGEAEGPTRSASVIPDERKEKLEYAPAYPSTSSVATDEEEIEGHDSRSTVTSGASLSESAPGRLPPEVVTDVKAITTTSEVVQPDEETVTVNDTLKVIFVGMALAGKTSMIKRLIEGRDAVIPKRDERTVGVDIYEWDPKKDEREEIRHIDTRIDVQDKELAPTCGDVNVKFSVWDFAGQHVYHATHELFFSPRALYVLVWDMGATNSATQRKKSVITDDVEGAFKLSYDSSDEEDDDFVAEEEARRADRALERDVDEKVQFWVDCIQSSAPGAAIMPVASFDDYFESGGSKEEAKRRCEVMKQRLLKHETRRIKGLKERLKEFEKEGRANDEGALRLRKLLCPYTRPKLIFGTKDEDSVVRVSGTKYTGFDTLTQKIVNIATGRDQAGWKYPIFRGHVGVRIPRMRLEVLKSVREMRDRFKVVEWGYFLSTLSQNGSYSPEDVSDALHFLTNVGELSYFGNVLPDKDRMEELMMKRDSNIINPASLPTLDPDDYDSDYYDEDNEGKLLSIDETSTTVQSTAGDEFSLTTTRDICVTGLSQFVFLNPRWLVAAVACILRHDLSREITETKRLVAQSRKAHLERGDSFVYDANQNCPVITASDACLLWQAKKFTKKAAERAQEYSNNMAVTPFDFLQRLLVRFGVFVPIDLSIDKAYLGGREYANYDGRENGESQPPTELHLELNSPDAPETPNYFFLPSLLGPGEPAEAWTYKNTDSWTTTLCHSILFPDAVPPGLMERVTASVLSSVYAAAKHGETVDGEVQEGQLRVKEILCWRTAFFLKIGTVTKDNGELKEGYAEIFIHIVDRESHLCVGSDNMGVGMRRLVLSAKGQVGDCGRKIWTGGYFLVIKAVGRVMNEYGGLEYEKQGFCPECLAKKAVSQASHWDWTVLRAACHTGNDTLRCHNGHRVFTRLITGPGPSETLSKARLEAASQPRFVDGEPIVPVNELLRGVVVVGLWDGKTRKVVRAGSGFIVDKKRGLIVTASHTLMNIWGDKKSPFGENYYGIRDAKVAIGVIPRKKESGNVDGNGDGTMAVFRYFAKIVAKDESIEAKGECHLDACVLRITTRMENDVGGDGQGCGDQPETLLLYNPDAVKREKLHQLKVTDKCELDEQVRIIGYNQGGEGLLGPGERLNRYVDFARGYVCKKFAAGEEEGPEMEFRHRFKPREEIVVICPTIGGHSGGPCINQQGEVIGILSRADPAENQRCYLVPAYEWKALVKKAKHTF